MPIFNYFAVPSTAEYLRAATGSIVTLTTGNYIIGTGVATAYAGQFANRAFLSVEGANVRYKFRFSTPATNCGHLFLAGDYMSLDDFNQMQGLSFLNEAGSGTAYIFVTYFVD